MMTSDIQPTLARLSAKLIELVEVEGNTCGGYEDYFGDYDCTYYPKITCEGCVFVVGRESGDYRRGKRPWRKSK